MLERIPIRWRLAITSAGLTFFILCTFAIGVGELTQRRIRDDFAHQVALAADRLPARLQLTYSAGTGRATIPPEQLEVVGAEDAVVRIVTQTGEVIAASNGAPHFAGLPQRGSDVTNGYRVETRPIFINRSGFGFMQYARPLSDLEATLRRVRFFLLFGVLGGTALSLLGGAMVARRAMSPIARLTAAAEEIRRTRDPDQRIDVPETDDEVSQLAATLDAMLQGLAASRAEMEEVLARQREFVADASHELRTPLTSVIANLELLADSLDGEPGDAARAALRSSQRMRRLVADLLLLARADARRQAPRQTVDLAAVVIDAAGEAGTLSTEHDLGVDVSPVRVDGVRDDLHRMVLNLMENALRHTPPGTHVQVRLAREGDTALLVVADDGPGVPDEMRERVFDRFVRGAGDHAGSFGLGLSIVRAVAEQHDGRATLEDAQPGARFVVRLPAVPSGSLDLDDDREHHRAPA